MRAPKRLLGKSWRLVTDKEKRVYVLDFLSTLYVLVVFISPISTEIMHAGGISSVVLVTLLDVIVPILIAYRFMNRLKEYARLRLKYTKPKKQKVQRNKRS